MARPRFKPAEEQRKLVEAMAGFGLKEEYIAQMVGPRGIDPKTLRKHFRQELDHGTAKANATVAQSAFKMAISGQHPAMTMFWLKCRAGWKEKSYLEHSGPEGGPMEISCAEFEQRITDELARIAAPQSTVAVSEEPAAGGAESAGVPVAGLEGAAESTGSRVGLEDMADPGGARLG